MINCIMRGTCRRRHALLQANFISLLGVSLALTVAAAQRQKLNSRHIPEAVARLTSVGDLPSSQRLNLAIGLPLRPPELAAFEPGNRPAVAQPTGTRQLAPADLRPGQPQLPSLPNARAVYCAIWAHGSG